ncbi:Pirin-like protein [Phytophthora cinnamomi]|uniref:Pirin-like protein n=1 Tax=Phytophthora cinnamomi TaxID=4785 RepID=UPI003559DE58|nr:Pirin-like protein [Phytophthora cinnamomi]
MKTVLLREIDVQVARVDPHGPSPAYVFAVRPRSRSPQNRLAAARRQDLDQTATLELHNVPVAHEVARTYSECRALYRELHHVTDCKNVRACCCALGSCPFWSLFAVLGSFEFPKRTLFNHQSQHVFEQRTQALTALMRTLLAALRANYRIRHFRCYQAPFGAAHMCKVLVALSLFLKLDNPDVEQALLEGGERLAYKLNLQGWQSDRANLYFSCEDKQKYRNTGQVQDRKSMELRGSLSMSSEDDCKDPTSEEEERSSLVLVWS